MMPWPSQAVSKVMTDNGLTEPTGECTPEFAGGGRCFILGKVLFTSLNYCLSLSFLPQLQNQLNDILELFKPSILPLGGFTYMALKYRLNYMK
jgi:hypothetical protein